MSKMTSMILINSVIFSMVYAGLYVDERFLHLYQFSMWGIVILGAFALFLPSKDLFKDGEGGRVYSVITWCISLIKVFICVWLGMSALAACLLFTTLCCYSKKRSFFELKVDNNE